MGPHGGAAPCASTARPRALPVPTRSCVGLSLGGCRYVITLHVSTKSLLPRLPHLLVSVSRGHCLVLLEGTGRASSGGRQTTARQACRLAQRLALHVTLLPTGLDWTGLDWTGLDYPSPQWFDDPDGVDGELRVKPRQLWLLCSSTVVLFRRAGRAGRRLGEHGNMASNGNDVMGRKQAAVEGNDGTSACLCPPTLAHNGSTACRTHRTPPAAASSCPAPSPTPSCTSPACSPPSATSPSPSRCPAFSPSSCWWVTRGKGKRVVLRGKRERELLILCTAQQ